MLSIFCQFLAKMTKINVVVNNRSSLFLYFSTLLVSRFGNGLSINFPLNWMHVHDWLVMINFKSIFKSAEFFSNYISIFIYCGWKTHFLLVTCVSLLSRVKLIECWIVDHIRFITSLVWFIWKILMIPFKC